MRTRTILCFAAAPVLSALPFLGTGRKALWIPYWPCGQQTIHACAFRSFSGPQDLSFEDLSALNNCMARGEPPPPGFTAIWPRLETARTTGHVDWIGRHQVRVTVSNVAEQLQSARLYLDGALVGEATRDNGRIVDHTEEAEASIEFFLPWLAPYTVKLDTEDCNGRTESSSISVGSAPAKPR